MFRVQQFRALKSKISIALTPEARADLVAVAKAESNIIE